MPRFLSVDWVAAFNQAVVGATLAVPGDGESVTAAGGTFSVAQLVRDVPGSGGTPPGEVGTLLQVERGALELSLFDPGAGPPVAPSVTISLAYADAAALSRGELDAAELLGTGRIRVRGDLSVLVVGQSLLAQAAGQLHGLQATTTY